jgi:hypothetical protein
MSQVGEGRAEAAAAIWAWRTTGAASSTDLASPSAARRRGLLRALVVGALGAALLAFWSPLLGRIVLGIASLVALAALLSPLGIYAALERGLGVLAYKTGVLLTWVLMAVIFYAVFTPFGLIFRRGRRDSLRRASDPALSSYWEAAERGRSASASRRQAW